MDSLRGHRNNGSPLLCTSRSHTRDQDSCNDHDRVDCISSRPDDLNDKESEAAFQDNHEKEILVVFEPNNETEEAQYSGTKKFSQCKSTEGDEAGPV
jgi:hypothetical protein